KRKLGIGLIKRRYNMNFSISMLKTSSSSKTKLLDDVTFCDNEDVLIVDSIGSERVVVLFGFLDGGLQLVQLGFKSSGYDTISNAFRAKYGKPTSLEKGTVQNHMGAAFDNEIALWVGKNAVIRMEKRKGKVDTSAIVIATKKALKNTQYNIDKRAADAERDLK